MLRILALSLALALPATGAAQELRFTIIQESMTLRKSEIVYAQAFFRDGRWVVEIKFNFLAAGKVRELTARNERKQMQIVINDRILSEPFIMGQIEGGVDVLEGNFSQAHAKEIAARFQ